MAKSRPQSEGCTANAPQTSGLNRRALTADVAALSPQMPSAPVQGTQQRHVDNDDAAVAQQQWPRSA
eukprot:11141284-Alexandrium_andersonii.AAC.1